MNNKQRELIVDGFIQHEENGYRSDPVGDYEDTTNFFRRLIETDEKLEKMAIEARAEWEKKP